MFVLGVVELAEIIIKASIRKYLFLQPQRRSQKETRSGLSKNSIKHVQSKNQSSIFATCG